MVKILVVSDSHGEIDLLQKLYLKHQDFSYFLHLGDSELPSFYIQPFLSVKGNCDYENYPLQRLLTINNINIFFEHGQNYPFKDLDYIKSKNCSIYLHGHTHIKSLNKVDNLYIANPGSLTRPRDGNRGSYLVITINDQNIEFNFHEIDLNNL